jgi:hypothetical protein
MSFVFDDAQSHESPPLIGWAAPSYSPPGCPDSARVSINILQH